MCKRARGYNDKIARLLESPRVQDSTIGIIWELGQIGDEQVARRLGQYLLESLTNALKDKESQVRYHVARALEKLGNQDAIPFLKDALQDENHGVRKEAMRALKSLSVPESELPEIPDKPKRKQESEKISLERFQEERRLPTKEDYA